MGVSKAISVGTTLPARKEAEGKFGKPSEARGNIRNEKGGTHPNRSVV